MELKEIFQLVGQVDRLSDPDFEFFYRILLIRAMGRELRRTDLPKPPKREVTLET